MIPYLNTQQEEREVEVDPRKNIFVGDRHQDGRAAVCENSGNWVLRYSTGALVCGSAHDGRGRSGAPGRGHIDSVVVAFLIVGHGNKGAVQRMDSPLRTDVRGNWGSGAVGAEKDRTLEGEAEKRSVARQITQGRVRVGLNLYVSPGLKGVGLRGVISRGEWR